VALAFARLRGGRAAKDEEELDEEEEEDGDTDE
jgi:hypothetical protein